MLIVTLLWFFCSLLMVTGTTLSMLRGSSWWMRVWDFPRVQILFCAVALSVVGMLVPTGFTMTNSEALSSPIIRSLWIAVMGLLILAIIRQGSWSIRMTPLVSTDVPNASDDEALRCRVIASNVDYTNSNPDSAMHKLMAHEPDLLALVEVDEAWQTSISEHCAELPNQIVEYRANGKGIALLSKYELHNPQVRTLVLDDRPSIWTAIRMSDMIQDWINRDHTKADPPIDDTMVGICVLHPPPPGLKKRHKDERVSSKPRDIEIEVAARTIAESPIEHWIMVGDFNDVGWSRTTEHAKSIGKLYDPRIGRGFYNTFPARIPLLRYPIDHVLVTRAFCVSHLARLEDIGSDHLPLLTDIHINPES
ncbi:MAG: endonuclease/exonuclease/phosphatase family protein [Phycisphaerales bacterium]|nr:endonuclease/exonuclease/phosphatase family protein [Phycisphaerales bacterium]